ncbi:MAG: S-layer homology domain-containing protein [Oscillospiraceae bacterium]
MNKTERTQNTKIFKKVLAMFLTLVMIATTFSSMVFADGDKGLENAIVSVKERINIPSEYSEFTSRINKTDIDTSYYLTWSIPENDNNSQNEIRVTVNNFGDITTYDTSNYKIMNNREIAFSKFGNPELTDIAIEWLKNINLDWVSELPLDKVKCSTNTAFENMSYVEFPRYIDEIPFSENNVTVYIDNKTGNVVSMNSNWTYYDSLPSVEKIIEKEKAESAFKAESPMQLSYKLNDKDFGFLAYSTKDSKAMVNAENGEILQYSDYDMPRPHPDMENGTMSDGDGSADKNLSEAEIKNISEISELIELDTLKAFAIGVNEFGLDKLEFEKGYYQKSYSAKNEKNEKNEKYIATLQYSGKDENGKLNARLTVDAKTCEIISFSSYKYDENNDKKENVINSAKAKVKAENFIEKYAKNEYTNVRIEKNDKADNFSFKFNRYENDIVVDNQYINVNVDEKSGLITGFYKNWMNGCVFESAENIISADEASAKLMENVGLQLKYVNLEERNNSKKANVKLIYALNENIPTMLAASDGKILDYNGSEWNKNADAVKYPSDISGHYAEAKIKKLIETNLIKISDDSLFRPDAGITQAELLDFVLSLKNDGMLRPLNDGDIARLTKNAERYELLDEDFSPKAIANRQDGAKFIVRALGNGKVAMMQDIFTTGFADEGEISDGYKGYVAIAKGYKIINGDENNNVNPLAELSRADAAIMIFNYLAR